MATISIGGFNPFDKHAKTFEEAVNMAMDNDTIKINKHHLIIANGAKITKSLYIEGNNCTITINDTILGLYVVQGNLHINNVHFILGMQNNGIVFDDKYYGNSIFNNVTFNHTKQKLQETFPSFKVSAPQEGVSGCELTFNNCDIDYLSANCRSLNLTNCKIGKFYKLNSMGVASDMSISNLVADNTYFSSASPVEINQLTTAGQLTFNGNFTIDKLNLKNGEFDKGAGKLVSGKKADHMINDFINFDPRHNSKTDVILSAFGGDKYTSELKVHDIAVSDEAPQNYQRQWFSLVKTTFELDDCELPRLERPSIANNGAISMHNTKDYSDWQISKITLSNSNSISQLFQKKVVQAGQKVQQSANGNGSGDFGALAKLDSMIGLQNVKKQIKDFIKTAKVDNAMKQRGMKVDSTKSMHMVLAGSAGTGKTAVARLIAQALYENGVLKSNKFTEVQGGDLVAPYVGQTAPRTRQVVERALDGVLFIDEAYTLTHENGNSFKDEAVAELLKDIDDHRDRIVCILAGYTPNMRKFFAVSNPGLKSRFANWIDFPDYTPQEMLQIMSFMIKSQKLHLADADTALTLRKLLMDQMGHLDQNSGNGRFIRNALEKIVVEKDSRIGSLPADQMQSMSNEELMTITKPDVIAGMRDLAAQQENMGGLQGMNVN